MTDTTFAKAVILVWPLGFLVDLAGCWLLYRYISRSRRVAKELERVIAQVFLAVAERDDCPVCGGTREEGHDYECPLATAYADIGRDQHVVSAPAVKFDGLDDFFSWTGTVPLEPLEMRDRCGVDLELVSSQDDGMCGLALSIGFYDSDPHPQGLAMLLDRAQAAEVAAWLSAFASVDASPARTQWPGIARTDWASMLRGPEQWPGIAMSSVDAEGREVKTLPGFDPLVRDRTDEGWANICGRRLEVDGRPYVCIRERGHDEMAHEATTQMKHE